MKRLLALSLILVVMLSGFVGFTSLKETDLVVLLKHPDGTSAEGVSLFLYAFESHDASKQVKLATLSSDADGLVHFKQVIKPQLKGQFTNYVLRGFDPQTKESLVHHFTINEYEQSVSTLANFNGVPAYSLELGMKPLVADENSLASTDPYCYWIDPTPIFDSSVNEGLLWTTITELHSTDKMQTRVGWANSAELSVDVKFRYTYPTQAYWELGGGRSSFTTTAEKTNWLTYSGTANNAGNSIQTRYYYFTDKYHRNSADIPGYVCQRWEEVRVGGHFGGLNYAPLEGGSYDNLSYSLTRANHFGTHAETAGNTEASVTKGSGAKYMVGAHFKNSVQPKPGVYLDAKAQYTTQMTLEWMLWDADNKSYHPMYVTCPGPGKTRTTLGNAPAFYWTNSTR